MIPSDVRVLVTGGHYNVDSAPPAGWPFGLKWVHLPSSGLDIYPDWLFDGVVTTNSPDVYGEGIAEYAIAAIMAAAKQMPDLWMVGPTESPRPPLAEVSGAVLGLVGFGDIGQAVARRALALGMDVQCLRRSREPFPAGVRAAGDLQQLFATSDHVVLAAPASPQTAKMINGDILAAAKPGLHLVNVARGSLVDNKALLDALQAGALSRATLDVTDPEPLPAGHPFHGHPRIKLTPHIAWNSSGFMRRLAHSFEANVRRFRNGEPLAHVVQSIRARPVNHVVGRF